MRLDGEMTITMGAMAIIDGMREMNTMITETEEIVETGIETETEIETEIEGGLGDGAMTVTMIRYGLNKKEIS